MKLSIGSGSGGCLKNRQRSRISWWKTILNPVSVSRTLLGCIHMLVGCTCISAHIYGHERHSAHIYELERKQRLFSTSNRTYDDQPIDTSFRNRFLGPLTASILQTCIDLCQDNGHCCGNRLNLEVIGSSHNLLSCAIGCEIAYYEKTVRSCKSRCKVGNKQDCFYKHPIIGSLVKCQACQPGCEGSTSTDECSKGCDLAATIDDYYYVSGPLEMISEWCTVKNPCKKQTGGMWAVLWDPKYGNKYVGDAKKMIKRLNNVRKDTIQHYKFKDPPQKAKGYYYNIYIHHGGEDMFPEGWGVGQGTDGYGNPFLTFGPPYHIDLGFLDHEGFHVFQYSANSPGFVYSGDSQWYIEATANWFDNYRNYKNTDEGFHCGAIEAIPHQALWHSFDNGAPSDPINWSTGIRQYAMSVLLFYMTEIAKIDRSAIASGFYDAITDLPQMHLFKKTIGNSKFRQVFVNWASHNVNDFDYLTRAQVENSRQEVEFNGDKTLFRPYAITSGINAVITKRTAPPKKYRPRGWSYNVIKLNTNGRTGSFRVSINGAKKGSKGATSFFEARMVIKGDSKTRFVRIKMKRGLNGAKKVNLTSSDKVLFLVIAAVPTHMKGNQNYNYNFLITG